MRTLTDIELQYVSGGFTSTPAPSPNPSPNPSQPNKPWYEDIADAVTRSITRITDAIAGAIEDIGAGIRDVLADGAETVRISKCDFTYERTSCETGQNKDGDKCTYPPKGN